MRVWVCVSELEAQAGGTSAGGSVSAIETSQKVPSISSTIPPALSTSVLRLYGLCSYGCDYGVSHSYILSGLFFLYIIQQETKQ